MIFLDRKDAGRRLAERLTEYSEKENVLVLALPRGGVPVAFEVARTLGIPLDVFLVRKIGVPGREELAMGAIASGGTRVLNKMVIDPLRIPENVIEAVAEKERIELERREKAYRDDLPAPQVEKKIVILIDDGLATGATMRAAVKAVRELEPEKLIVAVPVASPDICDEFRQTVDKVVCLATPQPFHGVGVWYDDFSQTTDMEVREFLYESKLLENKRRLG